MTPTVPPYLANIRIVLSRTSHPANIGAAARAMKTMGLSRLYLVSPNLMQTPMTPNPPVFDPKQPAHFCLPDGWQAESRRAMAVRTGNLFMAAVFLFNGKDGRIITAVVGTCRLAAFRTLQSFRSVQDLFNFIPQIPFPNPTRSLSPNANKPA